MFLQAPSTEDVAATSRASILASGDVYANSPFCLGGVDVEIGVGRVFAVRIPANGALSGLGVEGGEGERRREEHEAWGGGRLLLG